MFNSIDSIGEYSLLETKAVLDSAQHKRSTMKESHREVTITNQKFNFHFLFCPIEILLAKYQLYTTP